MRVITKEKAEKIEEIIKNNHLAFMVEVLGASVVSEEDYQKLDSLGMIKKPAFILDPVSTAFFVGAMQKNATQKELTTHLTDATLTAIEKEAIDNAKDKVGDYIKGLGDKQISSLRTILTEAEEGQRKAELLQVRETVATGIRKRQTAREIAKKLEQATGDSSKDWFRIASTELQNAMEEGRVASIVKERGPSVLVFRRPKEDACPFCKLLYLDGNKPRIFRLSDLVSNGSNIGKKARRPTLTGKDKTEWLPIIGSTHPFCFPSGSMITTVDGQKPIEQVKEGDIVLTHKHRWRKVTATMRRSYKDDLVVLRWGRGEIKATKNHPFLTARGWVEAQSLNEQDEFFEVFGSSIPRPEVHGKPPVITKSVEFISILDRFSRGAVPISPVNLDSKFNLRQGEIDVVRAQSQKGLGNNSFFEEFISKKLFKGRELLSLLCGVGYFFSRFPRLFFSSQSFMGLFGELFSRCFGGSLVPECQSFCAVSDRETHQSKSVDDYTSAHMQGFCNVKNGQPLSIESSNFVKFYKNFLSHDVDPFVQTLANETRNVSVTISRECFQGEVYNFSVEEDESYVCNNLVVHNCQCSTQYLPESMGFDDSGNMVYQKSIKVETLNPLLLAHTCVK